MLKKGFKRAKQRVLSNRLSLALKRQVLGTITHVETEEPVVALTFDDGPNPTFTPRLLEILDKHRARATFFMVGKAAAEHPELVRQVAEAGHAIGNHTWDHLSLPSLPGNERREAVRNCQKALAPFGERLLRPPYGHQNLGSRLDAMRLGYQVVTWTIVAEDWLERDAEWMVEEIEKELQPGSIICLHDSIYRDWHEDGEPHYDRDQTLDAVERLLDRHTDYRFVTVPELLRHGRVVRRYWRVQQNDDYKSLAYRW